MLLAVWLILNFIAYLQRKAIELSWDLLTNVYKLPKDRLYVTYFEGHQEKGIPCDEETKEIWLDLG